MISTAHEAGLSEEDAKTVVELISPLCRKCMQKWSISETVLVQSTQPAISDNAEYKSKEHLNGKLYTKPDLA